MRATAALYEGDWLLHEISVFLRLKCWERGQKLRGRGVLTLSSLCEQTP